MQVNILAGGGAELWPTDIFDQPGVWIGADRGAWRLLKAGVNFQLAVGDFDSLNPQEYQFLKEHFQQENIKQVPTVKDFTDTQLALQTAMNFDCDLIKVYGATGGRVDHLLSNLWIINEPVFQPIVEKVHFVDCQNDISYLQPGYKTIQHIPGMKYLGFMPLGLVDNLHIIDAKYTLTSAVNWPKMWSSNEFVDELVHVSFDSGIIMVTQTKDRSSDDSRSSN